FFVSTPPTPHSTLFPYTTLFRSLLLTTTARADDDTNNNEDEYEEHARVLRVSLLKGEVSLKRADSIEWETARLNTPLVEGDTLRSEEHTSELLSLAYLVCRLLLE